MPELAPEIVKPETVTEARDRSCLKCAETFFSFNFGNRLCQKCGTDNDRQYDKSVNIISDKAAVPHD